MKITIIAQAATPGAVETTGSVSGDILTIDGVIHDLTAVPEGGLVSFEPEGDETLPFIGSGTRINGEICLSALFQYDASTAEPHQPKDLVTLSLTSGPLPDPITRLPLEIQP